MTIIRPMRRLLFLLIIVLLTPTAWGQVAANPQESLRFSCVDKAFLSISLSTPRRDQFLNLDIGLADPAGRTVGMGHSDHPIPNSQYAKVIEIPSHPERSKAVAIEICGASPGVYLVTVSERAGLDYRLTVRADDGSGSNNGNDAEPVPIRGEGDRVCHYTFKLEMQNGVVSIRWLDKSGHHLRFAELPTCDAVPRT